MTQISDILDTLRRIIEDIVGRELAYLPLEAARKVARRIAAETLEEMRRAGIEAKWRVGFGPWRISDDDDS